MEILYRAAKQDTLRDGGITFRGQPKVKAIFEVLVNKSVQVCVNWLTPVFKALGWLVIAAEHWSLSNCSSVTSSLS